MQKSLLQLKFLEVNPILDKKNKTAQVAAALMGS
jgi:arginase family enzyme